MKKNLFLLFIFVIFAVTNIYPQKLIQRMMSDTIISGADKAVKLTIIKGTENNYLLNFTDGTDRYTFDNKDFKDFIGEKIVTKRDNHFFGFPTSLLPIVTTSNAAEVKNYVYKDGYVKLAGAPQLIIEESSFSPAATILLYLPLLFIFVVFISSWDTNKGKEQVIIFTTSSSLAMVIGAIGGMWLGPTFGLCVGGITGFCAMFLTSLSTDYFKRALSAVLATVISAGMVGAYVGEIFRCGFKFYEPEMFILWLYLGYYLAACLAAIGIRSLVIARKNRNSRNEQYGFRFSGK